MMRGDRLLEDLASVNPVAPGKAASLVPGWEPSEALETILDSPKEVAANPSDPRVAVTHQPSDRRRVRTVVVVVAALLAAAFALPAFGVGRTIVDSITSFLSSDAPPQAKQAIASLVRGTSFPGAGTPTDIRLVLSARGPEGELQLYELHFSNGDVGATAVDTTNNPPRTAASSWGPIRPIPAGQAIDVRGSSVRFPGRSPVYFNGLVASDVAMVVVRYATGVTEPVPVGGGYMLGWITPQEDREYGNSQLVALDAHGNQVGRFDVCAVGRSVEFRAHTAGMPDDPAAACALPPAPDHG